MAQKHGYYLNKMNIVLVSLSAKSSGEFTAQWWTGEAGELELTKNSTSCVVGMTLWNSASWVDWDGQDMSYARTTMIYPGESSSVSQEESTPEGERESRWRERERFCVTILLLNLSCAFITLSTVTALRFYVPFSPLTQEPLLGPGSPIFEGSRSHSDTPL